MIKSILLSVLLLSLWSPHKAFADSSPASQSDFPEDKNLASVVASVDGLLAVGTKIWKIVEASRPVVSTNMSQTVSVLPDVGGAPPPIFRMTNWSQPRFQSYRISYKNKAGHELVGFTYTIFFQHNGSYEGKGKYITNLKIKASEISTAALYSFDASSELVGISYTGSAEEPVASAIMQLNYTVKYVGREIRKTVSFYVDALGNIVVIP